MSRKKRFVWEPIIGPIFHQPMRPLQFPQLKILSRLVDQTGSRIQGTHVIMQHLLNVNIVDVASVNISVKNTLINLLTLTF